MNTPINYEKEYEIMFNQLVPSSSNADTILGELLRIEENCYDEAYRNGNANWFEERNERALFLINNFSKVTSFVADEAEYALAVAFLEKLKNYTVIWDKFLKNLPEEVDDDEDEDLELPEPFETQLNEYLVVCDEREPYTSIMKCLIDAWIANGKTGNIEKATD